MITLERLRLVNWHNFDDAVIDIGNRCLLAGDNGSGKSTVIDAIQYVMAANLRMARFNSAAEERRGGGRDLMGYVRCKVGSETSEYRRGDTVSHIMLEWSGPEKGEGFSCGVCVEAYRDNHYTEHFWTGSVSIADVSVRGDQDAPLTFRQFRDRLAAEQKIEVWENKRLYIRDLTNRLGVWKRQTDVNPYLDSLTRSIGFKPLDSIDQFVCDFILEENPVSIQDMKQNLENYKEADREARAASAKIDALKKICAKAAEWRNYDGLILKQEYLKLKIELENEKRRKESAAAELTSTENKLDFVVREIASLAQKRLDLEQELRAVDMSLAANDAHRLYEEINARIGRIKNNLAREGERSDSYHSLKAQCEALLGRALSEDFDAEIAALSEEAKKYQDEKYLAGKQKEEATEKLRDIRAELADIERGILRYPDAPRELRAALEKAGIAAFFLAEAAEVIDDAWVDAVEGWLNTRRFAALVDPAEFQAALEVYDRLPRSIAGAFIPNIATMRGAQVKPGSLAEVVKAEGYARLYLDYTLGRVMRADIGSLKTYESAVTKECMTYNNHTASRIKEEVYRRHYLGRSALEERKKFLDAEAVETEAALAAAEKAEREAAAREDCCDRVCVVSQNSNPSFPQSPCSPRSGMIWHRPKRNSRNWTPSLSGNWKRGEANLTDSWNCSKRTTTENRRKRAASKTKLKPAGTIWTVTPRRRRRGRRRSKLLAALTRLCSPSVKLMPKKNSRLWPLRNSAPPTNRRSRVSAPARNRLKKNTTNSSVITKRSFTISWAWSPRKTPRRKRCSNGLKHRSCPRTGKKSPGLTRTRKRNSKTTSSPGSTSTSRRRRRVSTR
ncbi:MAG: hypothetical protein LBR23_04895 [Spirochaetaceae bacterium]|jgi:energy-coupling factor transporter ATP-binding protein EcfA2|nr:hypothetical protein [Spirochaetaceae bacterium]